MRHIAATAALLLMTGAACASGSARDLNNDGVVDAYYDATFNQTWLAAPILSGNLSSMTYAIFLADSEFGDGWRLPISFVSPTFSASQCGPYPITGLEQFSCSGTVSAGQSEVSRLASDFAVDPFGWSTGAKGYAPDGNGSTIALYGILGKQDVTFVADSYDGDYGAWLVHDGDVGVAVSPVPEPASGMLAAAGLVGLALHRRRGASAKTAQ